jgi:hypothetical protein
MSSRIALTIAVSVLATAGGCAHFHEYFPSQRLLHPGRADYQRAQAKRFDPYPEPDIGAGANDFESQVRPPDFQRPMPEPTRARWTIGGM